MNTMNTIHDKPPAIDPDEVLPQVEKMLYKLAWKTAQSYPVTFEEARSEAYYAFVRSCADYRPDRGSKFSTWCYFWVWTHLKTFVTKRSVDPLTFVEIDDDLCGEPPTKKHQVLSDLLSTLSEEAKEIVSLLVETPGEVLNQFTPDDRRKVKARIKKFLAGESREDLPFILALNEIKSKLRATCA